MIHQVSRAFVASAFALLSTVATAQTLQVSPSPVLSRGADADVSYQDSARAGQTIVVTVTGGFPATTQEIFITLDAKGRGNGTFVVPTNWRNASFNAPGVSELTLPIH